jgi:hypothetical protein
VWVCSLFYTGFQSDLRSFYILSILLLLSFFMFHLRTLLLPPFKIIWFRKGVYGVGEGGDHQGCRLDIMESILASGTLKNFRFLMRSCLSTDRAPVIKLICSTFQPWSCITVLIALRRDAYWFSVVLLALTRYRSQTSDILLCSKIQKVPVVLTTGGRTAIPSGRIRQTLSFTTVSFGIPSLILLSSPDVRGRTISGSCHVPYRLLCQVQVLYILEFGCNFIPYSLEAFLA